MPGKSNIKILVYGWYNKGNIGDELFKEAYYKLFPEINFTFTDEITKESLSQADAIFFGGGSFLFAKPNINDELIPELEKKPIFYVGVGPETDIHPLHQKLIGIARGVFVRSFNFHNICGLNDQTMFIPDLVYSLYAPTKREYKDKSILFIPNILVVPTYNDPYWKHTAWNNFKCEVSQVLDALIVDGYKITFLPMCINPKQNDVWAAHEISSHMINRDKLFFIDSTLEFNNLCQEISHHQFIISQRYHGTILADMMHTPCISIHHHDKLKNFSTRNTNSIPYYGINKSGLLSSLHFSDYHEDDFRKEILQNNELFIIMQEKVRNILHYG